MPFKTKLDFSNNRQVKQHVATIQVLSGATSFGIPFNRLNSGPDLSTSGVTESYVGIVSTFSGNNTTTNYNWYDSRMELGHPTLSALTLSNSAITQNTGLVFTANTTTIIDDNLISLTYTGVTFDINDISIIDLGGGNYSGTVVSNSFNIISANTLDFTGRTIWADISGITRTNELIITKRPIIGNIWTCIDSEGRGEWAPVSGSSSGSSLTYWSASTGTNSIVPKFSNSIASGTLAIAEGVNTVASGYGSHAEGFSTTASGSYSHAGGFGINATISVKASGTASFNHSKVGDAYIGSGATAEGAVILGGLDQSVYSETSGIFAGFRNSILGGGQNNVIIGGYVNTIPTGITNTVIIGGDNTTAINSSYVYVPSLNIRTIGSSPFVNDIRIDSAGNLTTNTSDIRFKENIKPLTSSLDKIKKLNGVSYQWIDREAGGDSIKLGFIAQDVELIEPNLVFTNKHDGYKGIHIDGIIPLLVEAIKELSSGVTTSKNIYLETQTILAEDNYIELNFSGSVETAIGGGVKVQHAINEGLSADLITDKDGNWVTNTDFKSKALTIPMYTPESSNDNSGNLGNITRDDNYLYVKTINGWKRSILESF